MWAAQSSDGGSQPGTTAEAAAALPPIQLSFQLPALPPYAAMFQAAFPQGMPAPLAALQGYSGVLTSRPVPKCSRPSSTRQRVFRAPAFPEYRHGARANAGAAECGHGARASAGGRRAAPVQPVRATDLLKKVDLPQ